MFFIGFQIILLFLFVIFFGTFLKHKAIRFPLIFIGVFIIVLELVSIAFNNSLIDYRFYDQANLSDVWAIKGFFTWYIIGFLLLFIAFFFLMNYIILIIKKWNVKWGFSLGILLIIGALLVLPNGAVANIYEIVRLKSTKVGSFSNSLEMLGIDPKKYIPAEKIEAEAGKNIIVLSLESLERGYLEPPFEKVTPYLGSLSKNYTYLKMEPQEGSRWTTGSLYTAITGVPTYFKGDGNTIFQNTKDIQIGNLGSVLQKAGYEMSYLLADKNFSGMGDMLKTFGFEIISDENLQPGFETSEWGVQDKDMFKKLKEEILEKQKGGKPYAIFLSTISGHFPHGVYDKRMEGIIPKRDTPLEFMTSAVDYYIEDLFEFLKKNNFLNNTEVFIYPDHLLMGKLSEVLKKFRNERGLYVITTANKEKVLNGIQQPVMQIDIPRMIINGADIQTNATFLSSFIPKNKKKIAYIEENKKNLLAFNEAGIKREDYEKGFHFEITDYGKLKLSALENSSNEFFLKPPNNKLSVIYFTNNFRFLSQNTIQPNDANSPPIKSGYSQTDIESVFSIPPKGYAFIYSVKNDSIFSYLKKGNFLGIARKGKQSVSFFKNDISSLTGWKAMEEGEKLNSDELFIRSTELKSIPEYGTSRIYLGFKPMEVKRGINLLFIDDDNTYKVENTDYDADDISVKHLLDTINKLTKSQRLVAILVHDTTVRKLAKYKDELKSLNLSELANLKFREPYIAFFQNGILTEKTSETSVEASLSFEKYPTDRIDKIKTDLRRFIAHAGGGINGDVYTNSLEAMNESYKKGFRLFELDIAKTSDDIFVAGRHWDAWKRKTDYNGAIPPNLKTFKENPIKNYTPMDINDINRWFKNHRDAILITDKINDPGGFAKVFVDKNRLWMELFTFKAAEEAKKLGIETLLTQELLENVKGKELETLRKLDITKVAISRRFIKDNITLLNELKVAGIKAYAFHLYGKYNVDYMLKYEIDYIYGVYADKWEYGELNINSKKN